MEIPKDTTLESLVESVIPAIHARLVPVDAPLDSLTVTIRVERGGSWTATIRGPEMLIVEGESGHPNLWLFTTARTVERFLEDAAGPRRFFPKFEPVEGASSPAVLSDPRVVRRVAMADGRVELALRDDDGERLAIVFGFGRAAGKRIDPEDADVIIEAGASTLERVLAGHLAPEDALVDGGVTVRGSRFLAVQLALAVAPFYPARRR